jgi:hypothetical protein
LTIVSLAILLYIGTIDANKYRLPKMKTSGEIKRGLR